MNATLPVTTRPATVATNNGHAPPGTHTAPGTSTDLGQVINVTLSDALRIEPAQITVKAGMPVTFQVTNPGLLDHEFYVGDEAAQAEHEAEMVAMGGMMPHDEETGIAVKPGQAKDLTLTFPSPGVFLGGCHITNHYSGGMRTTITVTE